MLEHFYVMFGDPSCIGFEISCGITDRQTYRQTNTNAAENPTHTTTVGVDMSGNYLQIPPYPSLISTIFLSVPSKESNLVT